MIRSEPTTGDAPKLKTLEQRIAHGQTLLNEEAQKTIAKIGISSERQKSACLSAISSAKEKLEAALQITGQLTLPALAHTHTYTATPISPAHTPVTPAAAPTTSSAPIPSPTSDMPMNAAGIASVVNRNTEDQILERRLGIAAKGVALAVGAAVAGTAVYQANKWVNGLDWNSKKDTKPTNTAPANPGAAAQQAPKVDPTNPVLTVPATAPATSAPKVVQVAAPSKYELNTYDQLWTTINSDIIPNSKSFKRSTDILGDSEMREYELALKKLYPNSNINIAGVTYGLRGSIEECKSMAKSIGEELNRYQYKIGDNVKSFANIPCYTDGRLSGVYSFSTNSFVLYEGTKAETPIKQEAGPTVSANNTTTLGPTIPAIQTAKVETKTDPKISISKNIENYSALWERVTREILPITNGPTEKIKILNQEQTKLLQQAFKKGNNRDYQMGDKNFAFFSTSNNAEEGRAFAKSLGDFIEKLGYKIESGAEELALIPVFSTDGKQITNLWTIPKSSSENPKDLLLQTQKRDPVQMAANFQQNQYKTANQPNTYNTSNGYTFPGWRPGNTPSTQNTISQPRVIEIKDGVMTRFIINTN